MGVMYPAALLCAALVLQVHGFNEECDKKVDLAFAIDASRSIWKPDFVRQISFVKRIVEMFNVAPDQTRVAALTFGHEVQFEFNFKDVQDNALTAEEIDEIYHALGETTQTQLALKAVRENLFTPENGSRADVDHVCILLTDGASSNKTGTLKEAALLRQAGIKLFAIGVGKKVNETELRLIVTPPVAGHYFPAKDFQELDTEFFRKKFLDVTCRQITLPPRPFTTTTAAPTTPEELQDTTPAQKDKPKTTCQGKEADIVFIVDRSSSIWRQDFETQMRFVADVIGQFDVDNGKTQVSLITFSDDPRVEFYLNEHQNTERLRSIALRLNTTGGLTNSHLALQTMLTDVLTVHKGYRREVAHICIFITDGRSRFPERTAEMSNIVHEKGIYTFAIGVGNQTDVRELRQIASKPASTFVLEVRSYDLLETLKDLLAYRACKPRDDSSGPENLHLFQGKIMIGLHGIPPLYRQYVTEFILSLGGMFDLERGTVHLGLMENCGLPDIELGQFGSKVQFVQMVNQKMNNDGLGVFLTTFRQSVGPRATWHDNQKRVGILIFGDDIRDPDAIEREVYRLPSAYNKVVVIGLGKAGSTSGLDTLFSSMPTSSRVFLLSDPSMLSTRILGEALSFIVN